MVDLDDFDAVRREPDPIRRGKRATVLLTQYQQRATELARLRRVAIDDARRELGMSFTEIATAFGLSKGRITQIRTGAPVAERAFFGVGPVAIGVPIRHGLDDRARTFIDASDAAAQERAEAVLNALALAPTRFSISSDLAAPPSGDTVIICGPKSAPIAADLMGSDPVLGMAKDNGRWWVTDNRAEERYGSPLGDNPHTSADIAYVARHQRDGRVIIHIAGIHSHGSLGAVHYLGQHLAEVWSEVGDKPFSMAIRCTFENTDVTSSSLLVGPYVW